MENNTYVFGDALTRLRAAVDLVEMEPSAIGENLQTVRRCINDLQEAYQADDEYNNDRINELTNQISDLEARIENLTGGDDYPPYL